MLERKPVHHRSMYERLGNPATTLFTISMSTVSGPGGFVEAVKEENEVDESEDGDLGLWLVWSCIAGVCLRGRLGAPELGEGNGSVCVDGSWWLSCATWDASGGDGWS